MVGPDLTYGGIVRFFTSVYNGLMGIQKCFAEMQARKGEFLMENKKLGALAFLPLIVFLGTYIGCGIVFSVMGAESPFGYFPRHVALLVGIASALILAPGVKISEKVDVLTENMGRSGVMMIVLIYLMASGFQGAAAAIGGKTSVINLCLHYIPVKLLVPGVFMMCCFISTAIGTSMGTMAAMAPGCFGRSGRRRLKCGYRLCGSDRRFLFW